MAKTLRKFPGYAHSKYPWDEWCNGKIWQVTRGSDFAADVKTFRSQIYNRATVIGMAARSTVCGDVVTFQFVEKKPRK